MIPFYQPYNLEKSKEYIDQVIESGHLSGDGEMTKKCVQWLCDTFQVPSVLMTTSCTSALEIACMAIDLGPEDEVIVPSFTYPSTANAVLMAGCQVVLAPCSTDHYNLDLTKLQELITSKTKAIIVVHYGGVMVDMSELRRIAIDHNLIIIEDSAQSFLSRSDEGLAGTLGDFGCYSFHGTKDVIAGEGGALVINNVKYKNRCEEIRLKGTNQGQYRRKEIPQYEWVSKGSSYSPSELTMAMLYGQLKQSKEIIAFKKERFDRYSHFFEHHKFDRLEGYSKDDNQLVMNGHLFYLVFKTVDVASGFIKYMADKGIAVYTHFVPLHESVMGKQFIREGQDFIVEKDLGKRLVRLPLYPSLTRDQQELILQAAKDYMEDCV